MIRPVEFISEELIVCIGKEKHGGAAQDGRNDWALQHSLHKCKLGFSHFLRDEALNESNEYICEVQHIESKLY